MACDITTGLVAYWKFTNDLLDSSGNGLTMTNGGTTSTTDKDAVANQARLFDGNDYLSRAHSALFATTTYSLSMWVNVIDNSTFQYVMFKDRSGDFAGDHLFKLDGGNLTVVMQTGGGGGSTLTVAGAISTGWRHIVFTSNGVDAQKLYLDGTLTDTDTGAWSISTNPNILYFGGWATTSPVVNLTKMDEIRWYNVELDQDTIDALFAGYDAPSCGGATGSAMFFGGGL